MAAPGYRPANSMPPFGAMLVLSLAFLLTSIFLLLFWRERDAKCL